MVVSAVSPRTPTHWTSIVVVGSVCQVRNNVAGWNGASSRATFGGVSPKSGYEARPATEAPRNRRREGENMGVPEGRGVEITLPTRREELVQSPRCLGAGRRARASFLVNNSRPPVIDALRFGRRRAGEDGQRDPAGRPARPAQAMADATTTVGALKAAAGAFAAARKWEPFHTP